MKKILLSAGLMLAAVAMQAADFSATLLGGEFFFNIVDEDAATCEFAPNPNEPYNITLTGPWLPSTVNYNGKDYTIIGVGVEAFKDGYVTNGANNTTAQQREFWGFPTTLTYVRADAFNGFRSNFPAILRGNVTEFDATAMRNNKINAINTAGQAGTYLSTSQVQGYKVNVDDSYTATSALAASAGSIIYKVLDGDDKVLVAYPGDHRRTYHHFYQSGVDIFQFTNPDLYNELITEVNASGYVEIGDYAFYGNENVTKVNFDDALTTIGAHAFENSVLTTLTLPATITTIGEDAFKGVTTLTSITCNAATPPAVVFEDAVYAAIAENEQITVPEESLAAYQADENWGRFWAAAPPAAPKMYIAGTFTDWANGKLEMTENEGVYTITVNGITDGAEFKFIEGDENPVWYGGDAEGTTYGVHSDWCTDIPLSTTGVNFKISGGGDLTFTVSADKKLTVTGWPEPANELYLAGSMTNWDTDKEAMTLDNDGKFTITKEMAAGAEFKFIDQDGTWIGGDADGNFIVNEAQVVEGVELSLLLNGGNNFQIPVAGTWTLTVDKTTMKLVISGEWYAPKYAITIDENIQNGTVEADLAEAEEGETVTLTVTPAEGYQLETITVTPETLDLIVEVNNNEFTMPADNVTVTATFSLIPPTKYAITIDENIENGTVTADKAEAEESETVTLTVTPAEGYQLKTITVTGVNTDVLAPVDENNQFEMPADDVFVTA
ncbi:MAG: leucine-rich repeat protein, partial [Muribaculaceae bacterium]|nr:leucine-rich repeat protein [Muribaculaceae bacterium]